MRRGNPHPNFFASAFAKASADKPLKICASPQGGGYIPFIPHIAPGSKCIYDEPTKITWGFAKSCQIFDTKISHLKIMIKSWLCGIFAAWVYALAEHAEARI